MKEGGGSVKGPIVINCAHRCFTIVLILGSLSGHNMVEVMTVSKLNSGRKAPQVQSVFKG